MIDGGGSGSGKVTLMAVVGQLRTMRNREALNRIFLASAAETSLCFCPSEPLINLIELHSWRRKSDPRSLTWNLSGMRPREPDRTFSSASPVSQSREKFAREVDGIILDNWAKHKSHSALRHGCLRVRSTYQNSVWTKTSSFFRAKTRRKEKVQSLVRSYEPVGAAARRCHPRGRTLGRHRRRNRCGQKGHCSRRRRCFRSYCRSLPCSRQHPWILCPCSPQEL